MDLLQSQSHSNEPSQGIPSDTPGSFSCHPSEFRTLQDEKEFPDSQNPERGTMMLTGKYSKDAGEPPDGGLKAWSIILAYVCSHFIFIS